MKDGSVSYGQCEHVLLLKLNPKIFHIHRRTTEVLCQTHAEGSKRFFKSYFKPREFAVCKCGHWNLGGGGG